LDVKTQAEDPFAPTLQFMMFKDSNNKVNDRFNSAENTSIELYAGDFILILIYLNIPDKKILNGLIGMNVISRQM